MFTVVTVSVYKLLKYLLIKLAYLSYPPPLPLLSNINGSFGIKKTGVTTGFKPEQQSLVQNPKLYEYFNQHAASIIFQYDYSSYNSSIISFFHDNIKHRNK